GAPGQGVNATSVRAFPEGHAEALLRLLVRRADAAFHHLTAPERWTTSVGVLDADAFWLSWSSILLGMDAVTSLGAEWNQPEAIWTAFSALSILQGIWQGDRRSALPLFYLLDPRIPRHHAISSFRKGSPRVCARGVVNN